MTLVRGQVVYRDGAIVAQTGHGRLVSDDNMTGDKVNG